MQPTETISNRFARARYAAWAGDVEHCRRLLHDIRLESTKVSEPNHASAFGLMLRAASQLSERLEIERRRSEIAQNMFRPEKQVIITKHLRAVVHQSSEFEFELRAYLDDLSWEDSLYKRTSTVVADALALTRPQDPSLRRMETDQKQKPSRRPHASWRMVDQNAICVVYVCHFVIIIVK